MDKIEKNLLISEIQKLNIALIYKDEITLNDLLVNDIVIPFVNGHKIPKKEWLTYFMAENFIYLSFSCDSPSVILEGETATIEYKSILKGVFFNYLSTWRMLMELKFIKLEGKWKLAEIENPVIY